MGPLWRAVNTSNAQTGGNVVAPGCASKTVQKPARSPKNTSDKQNCHVENTAKQCKLGLFQDSDFAGDLEDSKSTSGGTL